VARLAGEFTGPPYVRPLGCGTPGEVLVAGSARARAARVSTPVPAPPSRSPVRGRQARRTSASGPWEVDVGRLEASELGVEGRARGRHLAQDLGGQARADHRDGDVEAGRVGEVDRPRRDTGRVRHGACSEPGEPCLVDPVDARPLVSQLLPRGQRQLDGALGQAGAQRGTVDERPGVHVHDPADPRGVPVDDLVDHSPGAAVPDEHHLALERRDDVENSADVVVVGDAGAVCRDVVQPREGHGVRGEVVGLQVQDDVVPGPPPEPEAGDEDDVDGVAVRERGVISHETSLASPW